jgi:hypothetical protein
MVTGMGSTFASRVGASLLYGVGLPVRQRRLWLQRLTKSNQGTERSCAAETDTTNPGFR